MTNKEAIDRWAEQIIPAVFKAEDALQKAKPEWKEKLKNVNGENGALLARLYCEEIATIIVTQAADYEPDGTIPYDNDPCNVELPDEEKTDETDDETE
jgi:hypothetical protein